MDDTHYRGGLEQLAGRNPQLSAKKEETRRRIIKSATHLFCDQGVRRTNMDEIAEHAGVSRGTLYGYAKNKEDLVVKALAEEQLNRWQPLFANDAPDEHLKSLLANSISTFARMPLLTLLAKGDADLLRTLENHPDVVAAFSTSDDELMSSAIRNAFPALSSSKLKSTTAAFRALSAAGPYLVDAAPTFGMTPDDLAAKLSDLLVDGIMSSK